MIKKELFHFLLFTFCLNSCELIETTLNETTETTIPVVEPTTMTREEAIQAYNEEYTSMSSYTWNGSVNNCDAGNIPQSILDVVLRRVNFYRKLVGLSTNCKLIENLNTNAQQAALIMHANGQLSHSPSSNWNCYSDEGANGANCNLAYTSWKRDKLQNYIDQWIKDAGSNNKAVGHRINILREKENISFGFGSTGNFAALSRDWLSGDEVEQKLTYIAYPPKGHIVSELVYPRWSFNITGINLSSATITMTDKQGNTIDLEKLTYDSSFNALVWEPNISTNISTDTQYTVEISNINGAHRDTYTYDVVLIKL